MNYEMSKYIIKIEEEIGAEYIGGAINWIDEKYNNAWSQELQKMDNELIICTDKKKLKLELDLYFNKSLRWIREYKQVGMPKTTDTINYISAKLKAK